MTGRLKVRLDMNHMIYGDRLDDHGRKFIGLHETVLPLCSIASARSVFQQLRGSTAKKSKQPAVAGAAPKINGRPNGRITGVDMRHLLLLLPFLLFDLLEDEIEQHNATIDKSMPSIHCLGFDTLGLETWSGITCIEDAFLVNRCTYTRIF